MDENILKNIISTYNLCNRKLDTSEEMIYSVKRNGFNDVLSNFIVAASLKYHLKRNLKEKPKPYNEIITGIVLILIGFGFTYLSFGSGGIVFILPLIMGIIGIPTLFKGIGNILDLSNSNQEKIFIDALLTEVRFDKRLSPSGQYLAIQKLIIPSKIVDFMTENLAGFDKTTKIYTVNYISLEFGKEVNIICIDKKLEAGLHKEITKSINNKFDTSYLIHDLTIPYMHDWIIETQSDLDKKDLF